MTGIQIYATDDFGNPADWNEDVQDFGIHFIWRTTISHGWFGLAVLGGLPPESLRGWPLNTDRFEIAIPLSEGENDFTLVGSGGAEGFDRFSLNLFFDENRGQPDICVLFTRLAPPLGEPVTQHRSDRAFTFGLQGINPPFDPPMFYDDGIWRVSVAAASFRPPGSPWSADFVGGQVLKPDGADDLIGVLRLMVDPSIDAGAAAPAPPPVAAQSWGNVASGAAAGAPGLPAGQGGPQITSGAAVSAPAVEDSGVGATNLGAVVEPSAEPTCDPAQAEPCGTPGPTSSPPVATPRTSPTPRGSPTATTPTAGAGPPVEATETEPRGGAASPSPAVQETPAVGSVGRRSKPGLSSRRSEGSDSGSRPGTAPSSPVVTPH